MNNKSTADLEKRNDELLKNLRLNSCITFKTTKENTASPAPCAVSSSPAQDSTKEPEENKSKHSEANSKKQSEEDWLKEWSSKNSSISFSNKKDTEQLVTQNTPVNKSQTYTCTFCKAGFDNQTNLIFHIPRCSKSSGSNSTKSTSEESSINDNQGALQRLLGSVSISQKSSGTTKLPPGVSVTPALPSSATNKCNQEETKVSTDSSEKSVSTVQQIKHLPKNISVNIKVSEKPVKKNGDNCEKSSSLPVITPNFKVESKKAAQKAKKKSNPTRKSKSLPKPSVSQASSPLQADLVTQDSNSSQLEAPVKKGSSTPSDLSEEDKPAKEDFLGFGNSAKSNENINLETPESSGKHGPVAHKSARKRTKKRLPKDLDQDYSSYPSSPALDTVNLNSKNYNKDPEYNICGLVELAATDVTKSYEFRRERRQVDSRPCIPCGISDLGSVEEFQFHHLQHIIDKKVVLTLHKLKDDSTIIESTTTNISEPIQNLNIDIPSQSDKANTPESTSSSSESFQKDSASNSPQRNSPDFANTPEPAESISTEVYEKTPLSSPEPTLKLTFKISESLDGKKKKTVSIVNNQAMNPNSQELPGNSSKPDNDQFSPSNAMIPEPNVPQTSTGYLEGALTANIAPSQEESLEAPEPEQPPSSPNLTNLDAQFPPNPALPPPGSTYEPQFESYPGEWLQEYDSGNRIAAAMTGSTSQDGLFSQAVLEGSDYRQPQSNSSQGSFEQFCINDPYTQAQTAQVTNPIPNQQNYGPNPTNSLGNYGYSNELNNTADNYNLSNHSANMLGDNIQQNSTSPMTAALPPTDFTSALQANENQTPPIASGKTPPLPAQPHSTSPSTFSQAEPSVPRITIASNLIANSSVPGTTEPRDNYAQPWMQQNSNQFQNFNQTPSLIPAIRNTVPRMPQAYRPSPRPRIRGRPPLIDQVTTRPPRFTSPPSAVRGRGGINQRPFGAYNNLRQQNPNVKRPMNSHTSPNKVAKREDINVPSRQRDNDCQIIAVANRNEGMPVISNIQGSNHDNQQKRRTASPTKDSAIHLSDSITLSVRSNGNQNDSRRNEKGGSGVANMLAARGITVTPAAGEKEGTQDRRPEQRLPSASELNLSSAISVHPPTSRDRDGFAVPLPPSKPSSSHNQPDRPPRPPTVDLTDEFSGSQNGRVYCSQCDKSFPNQALLADHARIHQQQAQSRMSFKCHLCTAGFSSQKGQQQHYQQFHQLHLSAGDLGIPIVDLRNPTNIQKMQRLGIKAFLPLNNLQNRGAGGVVGIPILSLENISNSSMSLQQWGINDVLSLGPPKTINTPR